jgi:indolepyruvate ferredoxin oxidoreductase
MTLRAISLDDKFDLTHSPILLNGTQALVRLMLMQKARDQAAGLHTAGYVTGYRGSLTELPLQIRGFGPVKEANAAAAAKRRLDLLDLYHAANQKTDPHP